MMDYSNISIKERKLEEDSQYRQSGPSIMIISLG